MLKLKSQLIEKLVINRKPYFSWLLILLLTGLFMLTLTSTIIYAAENVWNIQRTTNNNDLDFFPTSNPGTPTLKLKTNGVVQISGSLQPAKLIDLNNPLFFLDPDGASFLNTAAFNSITTSGNIGIGTASPGEKLDISGNARISQGGYLKFTHSGGSDINDGKMGAGIFAPGLNLVGIRTDNSYRKISLWGEITQQQNDGFNTFRGVTTINGGALSAPAVANSLKPGALDIGNVSQDYGGGTTQWTSSTGVAGFLMEAKDNTEIAVHDVGERLASLVYYQGGNTTTNPNANKITIGRNMGWGTISTIALNGNVGIGTAAPTAKLDVNGTFRCCGQAANAVGMGTITAADAGLGIGWNGSGGNGEVDFYGLFNGHGANYSAFRFYSYNSTATPNMATPLLTLNRNYKVGINTPGPTTDLHIKQTSNNWASGGGIRLERFDNAGFAGIFEGSDNALYLVANSGNYFCAVTAGTTIYCSSDRRLKENITPLDISALDTLSKLKPSTFNWKSNGVHSTGFIAQEVKEVLPEAVTYSEDMGNYGLSDSYFTPYMVKGIQELNDQVKNQQSEIDLLKKEIEELKKSR